MQMAVFVFVFKSADENSHREGVTERFTRSLCGFSPAFFSSVSLTLYSPTILPKCFLLLVLLLPSSLLNDEQSLYFQTVALSNVAVNTNWTGATIMCQAALNGGKYSSARLKLQSNWI